MTNRVFEDTGMILEGGGSKGVFTAGVLDYFTEQGVFTSYVAGVSAGACNAVDYISKQPGRTKSCMVIRDKAYEYASLTNLIVKRNFFDMDLIFDRFPNELIPFDYDEYFSSIASGVRCDIVATNCITGRAEYLHEKSDGKRLMMLARASSSLPFLAPMVNIDGTPYMDGGIADSIPLGHAFRCGVKKNILILTKQRGYRKQPFGTNRIAVTEQKFGKYPEFIRTYIHRPEVYNRQLEIIERLEDEGKIFVIRPEIEPVKRTEHNADTLDGFYDHGRVVAEEVIDDMVSFMES